MLFANPVEPELVEGGFYDRLATSYYLSPDKLESDYAPVRFVRELRLFRRFCRSGQVLDVGCSTGAFLHQLTHRFPGRYQALGTDVCGPALDYAESRGVPVLRTPFLKHDFAGQQFDAVTFWAVLEHLAEPRKFLVKAASLLKPGGHCFALVPNFHSLAARWLGTRYRYITKEHLNYFTAETMQRLVAQEPALRVVALTSTHFNPVVLWQDWRGGGRPVTEAERARLLKRTTRWKASSRLAPLGWIYAGVERLLAGLRLGDNLAMVLRRR
jgi:2-polyprenyl-3-methyl-5-hydroxy-6-metoxy-1,4-benzoquinol methylase